MWGAIARSIWQAASMIGLGATIQSWFMTDDDGGDNSNPWKIIWPLLAAAAVVVVIYKVLGKKIRIG